LNICKTEQKDGEGGSGRMMLRVNLTRAHCKSIYGNVIMKPSTQLIYAIKMFKKEKQKSSLNKYHNKITQRIPTCGHVSSIQCSTGERLKYPERPFDQTLLF
jgi:hypothetical protein